jgi:hypothetical protein
MVGRFDGFCKEILANAIFVLSSKLKPEFSDLFKTSSHLSGFKKYPKFSHFG